MTKEQIEKSVADAALVTARIIMEGVALETFSGWDYEIEFDVEVDMEKGEVKILSVDGHDLKY